MIERILDFVNSIVLSSSEKKILGDDCQEKETKLRTMQDQLQSS